MTLQACERYGSNKEEYNFLYTGENVTQRIDTNQTTSSKLVWIKQFFKSGFLPQGYPDSVSEDYLEYQLWDTLQAFCSSITGTLATQAVLKGYGVGDETATVAGATITWMLKDGMGMVGRIMFAWLKGTQLDCDAKRWRLFADVLNDLAILLDLVAPLFKPFFVMIVCISSVARSIVGVAGGATRAALTLHQARRDNMADVSAKDGSQETLVNLLALLSGFIITPLVADNPLLVWILFFVFTFLHLFANYCAVCCVVMETLNLPRLYLSIRHYLTYNKILSPKEISKSDPVLLSPGYTCVIRPGSRLESVIKRYEDLRYAESKPCMYVAGFNKKRSEINIVLHADVTDTDIMKSCFHALLLDIFINVVHNKLELDTVSPEVQSFLGMLKNNDDNDYSFTWQMEKMEVIVESLYPSFEAGLTEAGWDLKICHLAVDEWRTQWNKKMK